MTDMNSGYHGFSMSNRAVAAYEDGEMPESKWTKKAMLAAIADWAEDNGRVMDEDVAAMKKADLFDELFAMTSWHHTSKYCNVTYFYGLDERAAKQHSRSLSGEDDDEEIVEPATEYDAQASHEASKAAYEAYRKEHLAWEADQRKFRAMFPDADTLVRTMVQRFPERMEFKTGRAGRVPAVVIAADTERKFSYCFEGGHWRGTEFNVDDFGFLLD